MCRVSEWALQAAGMGLIHRDLEPREFNRSKPTKRCFEQATLLRVAYLDSADAVIIVSLTKHLSTLFRALRFDVYLATGLFSDTRRIS